MSICAGRTCVLLAVVTGIAAIAACNALVVPLLLEREIERHGKSLLIRQTLEMGGLAGHNGTWSADCPLQRAAQQL